MRRVLLVLILILNVSFNLLFAQVPESFEGAFPPAGWASMDNGIGTLESWEQSSDPNTGTYSAFISFENVSSGLTADYLISPAIQISNTNTDLIFYHKDEYPSNYGSLYYIQVSTSTQLDSANYTTVASYTESDLTNSFQADTVDFSAYAGQTVYIVFKMTNDDGDNWYIDDISFPVDPPSCPAPFTLGASNILATSADFFWTDTTAATEWQIEYDSAGFTLNTGVSSIVNNDTVHITGLSPSASYEFYVRSICAPGDTSAIAGPYSFVTPCFAISAPYLFDFSNYLDSCWSEAEGVLGNNSTISYGNSNWIEDGFGNNTSVGSARLNIYSSDKDEWIVSPGIDLGTGSNPQQLEFDVILTDYSGIGNDNMGPDDSLAVVISTDNGLTWSRSNILQLWTAANQPSNSGEHVKISLAGYTGMVKIGFYGASSIYNTDYNVYIDNFELSFLPANNVTLVDLIAPQPLCAGPNNVSLVLTNNGSNPIDSVEFAYHVNTFSDTANYPLTINIGDTAVIPLGAFPFVADSIYDITFYTFNPNSNPDGDPSDDTIRFNNMRTGLNGAYTIDSSKSTHGTNFNTITEFSNALKTFGMCGMTVANLTPGVHSGQLDIIDNTYPIVINGTDTSLATLTHDGSIRNATIFLKNASNVTIVGTTVEATGGSDSWGIQLYENVSDVIIATNRLVLSVASTSDKAGINISGSETSNSTMASNIQNINIASNSFYGGYTGVNIYGGSNQNERLSNIQIAGNNFEMQENYGIYAYYTDSLFIAGNTIKDLQGSSSDGIYLSDLENFTITGNKSIGMDNGMYIIDANSEYAVNSNAEISNNMFIGGDDGMNLEDIGFVNIYHNSVYAENYAVNLNNPDTLDIRNNIFYSNSSHAFHVLDSAYMVLDYNIYYSNGTGDLIRFGGTSNVYADLISFQTAVPTLNMNSLQGDPLFVSSTNLHVSGPLANDAGDNSLGITSDIDGDTRPLSPSTTVDIGADEFALASCLPPSSLNASANTGSTADLSWFENGSATEWEIEYDTTGFTQGSGNISVVNNDTVTITGLLPTTSYEFYVRAVCGAGDTSAWTGPFTFVTPCATISSLPYFEDFESSSANCYSEEFLNGTVTWMLSNGNSNGSVSAYSGSNNMLFVSTNSGDATMLVSPKFDLSSYSNVQLKFWHTQVNWVGDIDSLRIFYKTSATGTWNLLETYTIEYANWTEETLNLPNLSSDYYIGFEGNSNWARGITLDDITVMLAPTCLKPINLLVSQSTPNSVTVNWLDTNLATQWQIEFDTAGFTHGTGNTSIVNSDSVQLGGLSKGQYDFYVRTICAPGDTSSWSKLSFHVGYCDVTFPDDVEPITLVDFAGINNVTSATVNGTPELEDFTSITGTVNPGATYPIAVEGNTNGSYTTEVQVYFDWNQDGDFDELDEEYYIGSIINSTGTDNIQATANITVPTTAYAGTTRMRVTKKFNTVATACNTTGYGQAEDYTINVVIPIPTPQYTIGDLNSVDANGVADSLNVYAWTSGTVAGVDLDGTSGLSFTVIEQSGVAPAGMHVASSSAVSAYTVTEGDSLRLRGTVNQVNGLLILDVDSIDLISTNSALPAYTSISEPDEANESQLIQVQNMKVISVGTGTDFEVELSNGVDTVSMWVDADTDVDNLSFSLGQQICTVFGIGSQNDPNSPYLEEYKITPMLATDVLFSPTVDLGLDTIVCDTANFILDAGAGFASYSWNTGALTPSISPDELTDSLYIVTVTDAAGCSASDTVIVEVEICSGIKDNSLTNSFKIAPNPSAGIFTITAKGVNKENGKLLIRDISGKAIYTEEIIINSGEFKKEIDIHDFAKGIYFMTFNSGTQNISRKIVIQ